MSPWAASTADHESGALRIDPKKLRGLCAKRTAAVSRELAVRFSKSCFLRVWRVWDLDASNWALPLYCLYHPIAGKSGTYYICQCACRVLCPVKLSMCPVKLSSSLLPEQYLEVGYCPPSVTVGIIIITWVYIQLDNNYNMGIYSP